MNGVLQTLAKQEKTKLPRGKQEKRRNSEGEGGGRRVEEKGRANRQRGSMSIDHPVDRIDIKPDPVGKSWKKETGWNEPCEKEGGGGERRRRR